MAIKKPKQTNTFTAYKKDESYPSFQDMKLEKAQANKEKRETIISSGEPYICPKCKIAKKPDAFVVQYMTNDLIGTYRWLYECKECKKQRVATKRLYSSNTVQGAIQTIYKHVLQATRTQNLACDLAEKDIQAMWDKQDGKCYYTAYPMHYNSTLNKQFPEKIKFQVILDKKNPDGGYTKSNCVLCCMFIQKMKNNLDEKEFLKVCKDVISQLG